MVLGRGLPEGTLLNVNVPNIPSDRDRGRRGRTAGQAGLRGGGHREEGPAGQDLLLDRWTADVLGVRARHRLRRRIQRTRLRHAGPPRPDRLRGHGRAAKLAAGADPDRALEEDRGRNRLMDWESLRHEMAETQLVPRGISDEAVLDAMREVPRHLFVAAGMETRAYGDHALPIGEGQTISQPFMVALMTQALELTGHEKVLEIGTGSGYQTAVLARLAEQVFSIERVASLATARETSAGGTGRHERRHTNRGRHDRLEGVRTLRPHNRHGRSTGRTAEPRGATGRPGHHGRAGRHPRSAAAEDHREERWRESARDVGGCVFVPLVGREGWSEQT